MHAEAFCSFKKANLMENCFASEGYGLFETLMKQSDRRIIVHHITPNLKVQKTLRGLNFKGWSIKAVLHYKPCPTSLIG